MQLFRPAPAVRGIDPGVMIDYYLPKAPRKLAIDILDPHGKLVRSFAWRWRKRPRRKRKRRRRRTTEGAQEDPPKPAMKAGLNRFTWDMTYPGFTEFKGMIFWAAANAARWRCPATIRCG